MTLLEQWEDSLTPEKVKGMGYPNLLGQVTNLYNSGNEWQQDGTPEEVARVIWMEAMRAL